MRESNPFFKTWSPEMAWVLGLMFTDGNVWAEGKWLKSSLASNDYDMLEQVKQIVQVPNGIYLKKGTNTYILRLGGSDISRDLIALGCTTKKSLTLQFPNIEERYVADFVRGLWDGDGSIIFNTVKYGKLLSTSYITGSESFAKQLVMRIERAVGIEVVIQSVKQTEGWGKQIKYVIRYRKRKSIRLLNWMYASSTPLTRMSRKYNLAAPFLGQPPLLA